VCVCVCVWEREREKGGWMREEGTWDVEMHASVNAIIHSCGRRLS